jgi:hypothetical protein
VGSSAVEGTSQAVLRSPDPWKVPASLSLFLKSEKIPALLYVGKGPEHWSLRAFRPIPSAYWPWHRSKITEGPVLRPFSYTKFLMFATTANLKLCVNVASAFKVNKQHLKLVNTIYPKM